MTDNELTIIYGGLSLSGTIINAITKAYELVLDLGRKVGSAIKRGRTKNYCK